MGRDNLYKRVSTHSRPKAAGYDLKADGVSIYAVSTHSRPKAAGGDVKVYIEPIIVSTHSRPKAAG